MASVKIVVVGDGVVGKTCLLMSYAYNRFPSEYVPTVFDNLDTDVMVDGQKYTLHMYDTAGQSDFDHLRPLGYSKTDVFLICFGLDNPVSLANVTAKWLPELTQHAPKVPRILVGTKLDVREEKKGRGCVSEKEGQAVAMQLQAFAYMECSALTQMGLKDVFDKAIQSTFESTKKKKALKCVIL